MDLIVDANILFAALIKENVTSKMLFRSDFHLYGIDYLFDEFETYRVYILKKTNRSVEDFEEILNLLKRRIDIVPIEEIKPYIDLAQKISPDPKDIPYVALAIKLRMAIWSNDKKLKNGLENIVVYSTNELFDLFGPP